MEGGLGVGHRSGGVWGGWPSSDGGSAALCSWNPSFHVEDGPRPLWEQFAPLLCPLRRGGRERYCQPGSPGGSELDRTLEVIATNPSIDRQGNRGLGWGACSESWGDSAGGVCGLGPDPSVPSPSGCPCDRTVGVTDSGDPPLKAAAGAMLGAPQRRWLSAQGSNQWGWDFLGPLRGRSKQGRAHLGGCPSLGGRGGSRHMPRCPLPTQGLACRRSVPVES